MKKLFILGTFILLSGALIIGCKKDNTSSSAQNQTLKEKLLGKWSWQKTVLVKTNLSNGTKTTEDEEHPLSLDFKSDGNVLIIYDASTSMDRPYTIIDEQTFIWDTKTSKIDKIDAHNLVFTFENTVGEFKYSHTCTLTK